MVGKRGRGLWQDGWGEGEQVGKRVTGLARGQHSDECESQLTSVRSGWVLVRFASCTINGEYLQTPITRHRVHNHAHSQCTHSMPHCSHKARHYNKAHR